MIIYRTNPNNKTGSDCHCFLDGKPAVEMVDFVSTIIKRDESSCGGWQSHTAELKGKPGLIVVQVCYQKHPPYSSIRVLSITGEVLEDLPKVSHMVTRPINWDLIKQVTKFPEEAEARWAASENSEFV